MSIKKLSVKEISIEKMRELIVSIKDRYNLTAIPVRIKNEKRWESMDEIIEKTPFEGVPQRLNFDDGYGIIIYDWDIVEESLLNDIKCDYLRLLA